MIFSYALTYGITLNAGWNVSYWFLLLLAILHTAFLYVRKIAKERKIPLLLAISLLILVCIILTLFRLPWFMYFWNFAENMQKWQGNGAMDLKYGWLVLYFMLALGERLYWQLSKFIQTKLLLSFLILGVLIWQATMHMVWDVLPVAAALYTVLSGFTETYQRLIQRRKEIFAKDMLPFLVGVVILISFMPNSSEPISWNPVKQLYKQVQAGANELICEIAFWGEDSGFSVGNVGFSDGQNNFWGKLADGFSRKMMKLSVNSGSGKLEKYFTGVIKENYEDNNWTGADAIGTTDRSEYQWELQERLYNLYRSGLPGTDKEFFSKSSTYSLQYENLKTNTLFYPTNCYQIRTEEDTDKIKSVGSNIQFKDKQRKGDHYQVDAIQMNLDNENLVAYLQQVSAIKEGSYANVAEGNAQDGSKTLFMECVDALHLKQNDIKDVTDSSWEEKLAKREKNITQTDLQIPKQLPSRVKSLAEKITAADSNDYDKAQSIIRYLKKTGGYTYTTSPAKLEGDKDVVDSFLFESKKGYCSYFASAAAIMCRCAKVPARYVEGVVVDYKDETDGWYPILGKDAHAWIQVYIHGFGWIDLDATPGYEVDDGNWKKQEDEYQKYKQDVNPTQGADDNTSVDKKDVKKKTQLSTVTSYASYIGIGIGIVLGCFLLVLAAGRALSYHAYQSSSARQRAEICMSRLLQYLKKRGLPINQGETLRMYGKRLAEQQESNPDYMEALLWYEAVRYGNRDVTNQEVAWLERLCRQEKIRNRKIKRERRMRYVRVGKRSKK